jgi:hypothetical protein
MPTYTVHEPPPHEGRSADPERFVFVRDGFHFWAFVLAPLWLLFRRLWLVFVLYVIVTGVIDWLLTLAGLKGGSQFAASTVIALLIGLEAGALRRWTLERRGWKTLGFVVGDDLEAAERRFFGQWTRKESPKANVEAPPPSPPSAGSQYAAPVRRGAPSGSDVIGLFPEPGGGS